MSKISTMRQELISLVEEDLVEINEKYIVQGRWGIPDKRLHPWTICAIKEWVNQIPIWISKYNNNVKDTKDEGLYNLKDDTSKAPVMGPLPTVRPAIALNSGYRPVLFGVRGDSDGYTDLTDPKGHWTGFATDIGHKEMALYLWGSKAFSSDGYSYDTLRNSFRNIINNAGKDAGLVTYLARKGEFWHWGFSDSKCKNKDYIWHQFWDGNPYGIRPKSEIRKLRYSLGQKLGLL